MPSLREAIAAMNVIERQITISDPVALGIAAAYQFLPDASDDLELPCFMHQYVLIEQVLRPNGLRERRYLVRPQLLIGAMSQESAFHARCAASFDEAILDTFAAAVTLDGAVTLNTWRGETGVFQPTVLTFNKVDYVGLQYLVEVLIHDVVTVGP